MPVVHRFDPPERFVVGTVGEPGQRTFFLQARDGSRLTSVVLEKEQVVALAERVDEMLDEIVRTSGGDSAVPAVSPVELEDAEPLEQPIEEEFRVGTMTLAWDNAAEQVVLEIFSVEASAEDEDEEVAAEEAVAPDGGADAGEVLEVHLSPATARAFAKRASSVVAAGRPSCPFCGNPLDPQGHICPRANGFRRLTA
ncbi:MAG TPA: DUF3090 domain-containing protein [Nocardioidaceae bacterium]|nr:DUF3090 domain-containing protein [Nocardioidaceae bacterium]